MKKVTKIKSTNNSKLLAMLTSLSLALSLSSCYSSNEENKNNIVEETENTQDVWPRKEDTFTLDQDVANNMFYNNTVLNIDEVSNNFYAEYLNQINDGPDQDGYVCEISKNGQKYLVDASDYTKVYLAEYDNIGEADYATYLNQINGGPDQDGYVCEISKNGQKYLVDASDYTKVYLAEYDNIKKAYYVEYLNQINGGPDQDGYVCEISKNGINYLVDASNYTNIYATDFEYIIENKIYMKRPEGRMDVKNATNSIAEKSYVLTR